MVLVAEDKKTQVGNCMAKLPRIPKARGRWRGQLHLHWSPPCHSHQGRWSCFSTYIYIHTYKLRLSWFSLFLKDNLFSSKQRPFVLLFPDHRYHWEAEEGRYTWGAGHLPVAQAFSQGKGS